MEERMIHKKRGWIQNNYKWIIWGVVVISYSINFFHSLSMGVIKNSIIDEFKLSEVVFTNMVNTFSILYLIMQIPTGILVDTIGPRKISSIGVFISGIGTLIFSFGINVQFLFIGRSLIGLGTSVIFVSILKLVSKWFDDKKFGTMTGITCFIGTLGGAVAQSPLAKLTYAIGWRKSFLIVGILSLFIACLIYVLVRDNPKEMGLPSINDDSQDNEKIFLSDLISNSIKILKNIKFWPIFISYAMYYGSYVLIMGIWGTSFISDIYSISIISASSYITIGVVGSAIGAVVIGSISDKYLTRKKPLIVAGLIYIISWIILIITMGKISLFYLGILMFIIGFMSCAYVVGWPAAKEINNPKYDGISTAITNIGGFTGSIIIPIIAGFAFDNMKSGENIISAYKIVFGIVLVIICFGFVISLFTKETKCMNVYTKENKKS